MSFSNVLSKSSVQNRRVFYSFHHENDIWRVNNVRKSFSHRIKSSSRYTAKPRGVFDASIKEKSKRDREDSLRQLIRDGMKNTSVTCVLVGSETYVRPWVRFEIAQSVVKGNALLVVYINKLEDKNQSTSVAGPNPLDYMGIGCRKGRFLISERTNDDKWVPYEHHRKGITLPSSWEKPDPEKVIRLKNFADTYCYVDCDGSTNFVDWVHEAATKLEKK